MSDDALKSITYYSRFLAELFNRPSILYSTVSVWSVSPYTGIAEGEIFFKNGVRLRIREELDFDAFLIASYGYEIYQGEDRLYWYDDFPHPNDITLAPTYPHHKHIPPDIKHNRIPAQDLSFTNPNLPFLIQEIELRTLKKGKSK
jgi:hypothetical protein